MMTNKKDAVKFVGSLRGQLILGQALVIAIDKLEEVPEPYKEISNIADMQYLLDTLFALGKVAAKPIT